MTQTAEPTIDYIGNPDPLSLGDDYVVLGMYRARFADGFNVAWPHIGKPGTLSAGHLDFDNPEERAMLLVCANDLRDRACS